MNKYFMIDRCSSNLIGLFFKQWMFEPDHWIVRLLLNLERGAVGQGVSEGNKGLKPTAKTKV